MGAVLDTAERGRRCAPPREETRTVAGWSDARSSRSQEGLRRAALDSLKRLVERHLDSPELSADFICARSGWSRATVYRLFETEGGLARYIRQRHLLRALRELLSGQERHRRIVDLAVAHQFASEATFNRAFRRAFGIPPGAVRDLVASLRSAPSAAVRWGIGAELQNPHQPFPYQSAPERKPSCLI